MATAHLQEETELFARHKNAALTALSWLSSRLNDLVEAHVLSQCEMQEGLACVDKMVAAFNGATKIKQTPFPAPLEHCCAWLAFIYVFSAPIALASYSIGQKNAFGEYSTYKTVNPLLGLDDILVRTILAEIFLGAAFFGILELGDCLKDPFGNDASDLGSDMMTMGKGLEADLRSIMTPATVLPDYVLSGFSSSMVSSEGF